MAEASQHLSADPSNHQRWICFYPAYIDADKTVSEGRLVSKAQAVVMPDFNEIMAALSAKRLPSGVERKSYPRDTWQIGRVRVQLRKKDGSLVNPEFPNRLSVFRYVGEFINKLPSRPHVEMALAAKAKEAELTGSTPAQTSSELAIPGGRHHSNKKNRAASKKK